MIALVYLVWAPLGAEPLRAFLDSYRAHPAGAEHELVVVLNGEDGADAGAGPRGEAPPRPLTAGELRAELAELDCRVIRLERPLLDLAAYGEAARRLEHEWLCCLNSYSAILADGWLGTLAAAAAEPGVGLVGATGSWESQSPLVHGGVRHWLYQLAALPRERRAFPRFPNPHVRTTAFVVRRELALQLGLEGVGDKRTAYMLENGRRSITRQVERRGLEARVVGRDGQAYARGRWRESRTYRSGEQENLLVADNRTREWQQASPARRARLARQAWEGGIYPD